MRRKLAHQPKETIGETIKRARRECKNREYLKTLSNEKLFFTVLAANARKPFRNFDDDWLWKVVSGHYPWWRVPKRDGISDEENEDGRSWTRISTDFELPEEFMERFTRQLDWYYLSETQKMSASFVEHHKKVRIYRASIHNIFPEWFLRKHIDEINIYNQINRNMTAEQVLGRYNLFKNARWCNVEAEFDLNYFD